MRNTVSAARTRALGRHLAAHLLPGDLLCLYGELGAGKTTFVQGLAEGLRVGQPATSPSFTLVHQHEGRLTLHHIDLYRLAPGDLGDIGIEDMLASDAVLAIEWAERMPEALRTDGLDIEFDFHEARPSGRQVRLRARGPRGRRILKGLAERSDARART